jgi:hypothetical protein
MRTIKDTVRLSFKNKERTLANTTITRKVKEGDNWIEQEFPRVEREILIPETWDEAVVAIGGEQNVPLFFERVWTDYSATVARSEMNKLAETSSDDSALAKYLAASANFSMASILVSESKTEKVQRAVTQNDQISALALKRAAGEISDAEFALGVQKILGVIAG